GRTLDREERFAKLIEVSEAGAAAWLQKKGAALIPPCPIRLDPGTRTLYVRGVRIGRLPKLTFAALDYLCKCHPRPLGGPDFDDHFRTRVRGGRVMLIDAGRLLRDLLNKKYPDALRGVLRPPDGRWSGEGWRIVSD